MKAIAVLTMAFLPSTFIAVRLPILRNLSKGYGTDTLSDSLRYASLRLVGFSRKPNSL